jgi:hypothetical protein
MSAADVVVAVTGAVYIAPVGTPLPTSASAPLAAPWVDLGFVSEDGVKEVHDTDTDDITAWQDSATVRRLVTKQAVRYELGLLEQNATTVELVYGSPRTGALPGGPGGTPGGLRDIYTASYGALYGDPVPVAPGAPTSTVFVIDGKQHDDVALIVDVVDGSRLIRRCAPRVQVERTGETVLAANEATVFELSFHCLPDASIGGSVAAFYNLLR